MPPETTPLTMMEHPSIDEDIVPERYVAGQLSAEESARFEEHFFECAKCLESVELVRRFRDDLRNLPPGTLAPGSARRIEPATLLLAASLLVAVSAAVLFYRSDRGARRELEALRLQAAAPANGAAPPVRAPAAGEAERALASAPLAASVFTLNLTRGVSSEPDNRISVGGTEHWVVLLVDQPDAPGPYRIAVATADGRPVGRPVDAGAASSGMLAASFPSSLLPPGDYVLTVVQNGPASADRLATYRFRTASSPAP